MTKETKALYSGCPALNILFIDWSQHYSDQGGCLTATIMNIIFIWNAQLTQLYIETVILILFSKLLWILEGSPGWTAQRYYTTYNHPWKHWKSRFRRHKTPYKGSLLRQICFPTLLLSKSFIGPSIRDITLTGPALGSRNMMVVEYFIHKLHNLPINNLKS